jgi:histidine triad (HIT) family protein
MRAPDCIFCKIIAKEIPADIVFEDAYTLAFLDIHPTSKGHTLIVPKEHHVSIYEIPDTALCDVMKTVKKLAIAAKKGLGADGVNITMNNEPAAGQIVFHAHIHMIPRFSKDGLHGFSHGAPYPEKEALTIAEKIRAALL